MENVVTRAMEKILVEMDVINHRSDKGRNLTIGKSPLGHM